jgi:hypothetical protein
MLVSICEGVEARFEDRVGVRGGVWAEAIVGRDQGLTEESVDGLACSVEAQPAMRSVRLCDYVATLLGLSALGGLELEYLGNLGS